MRSGRQSCRKAGCTAAGMVVSVSELSLNRRPSCEAAACQYLDGGAHEQFETHQTAHRVAGQSEHERAAIVKFLNTEPQRLARAQRDLVKNLLNTELG